MKIETGECIYCGQVNSFEVEDNICLSKEERDRKATEVCDCDDAKNAHAQEQVLTTTQKNITALFSRRPTGNGKASAGCNGLYL